MSVVIAIIHPNPSPQPGESQAVARLTFEGAPQSPPPPGAPHGPGYRMQVRSNAGRPLWVAASDCPLALVQSGLLWVSMADWPVVADPSGIDYQEVLATVGTHAPVFPGAPRDAVAVLAGNFPGQRPQMDTRPLAPPTAAPRDDFRGPPPAGYRPMTDSDIGILDADQRAAFERLGDDGALRDKMARTHANAARMVERAKVGAARAAELREPGPAPDLPAPAVAADPPPRDYEAELKAALERARMATDRAERAEAAVLQVPAPSAETPAVLSSPRNGSDGAATKQQWAAALVAAGVDKTAAQLMRMKHAELVSLGAQVGCTPS